MKEVWTSEAKQTYLQNIEYLKLNWTKTEIERFIERSFEAIDLILKNPKLGQFDATWDAYKFLVLPQVYLFYIIDGESIVLLSFWNNYQKPLF